MVGRKAGLAESLAFGRPGGVKCPTIHLHVHYPSETSWIQCAASFFFSLENVIVIALYDFAASSDRDLELVKGEKLQVLSK